VTGLPIAPAAGPDPGLVDACGAEPGSACRFVFERTSSEGWAKVADFLVARPLKILLILVVAWLLARVVRRLIRRFVGRVAGSADGGRLHRARQRAPNVLGTGEETSLRSSARAQTIGQVLRSLSTAVISAFAATYVVAELGLELGPLIAGAGVIGVALGFGAQSLVKDFLSGMFMLIEDQYGVGDVVDVGDAVGTVEGVSLRSTRIRDVNGTVWHVPNGEIRRVGNKSQQWARGVVDVVVAAGADLARAETVLKETADRVCATPELAEDVLEDAEVWGVESVAPEGVTLRLVVKTRPGAQWTVMRALRLAIPDALATAGISVPTPPGTLVVRPDQVGGTDQR